MRKIRLHFNRRAKNGKVWSIQTSKVCFHAKNVKSSLPIETEYYSDRERNPKAFILMYGNTVKVNRDGTAIIE